MESKPRIYSTNDQFFDILIQNELLPKCMCYGIDKMLAKGNQLMWVVRIPLVQELPLCRFVLFSEALMTRSRGNTIRNRI